MDFLDSLVITAVIVARVVVPLAIPRFPLPAILAAMILDAVDQTVFQQLGVEDLGNYQSYDKALDVYYLAIAYVATLRNWTNVLAFETARFLWYYRLIGVVAFELLDIRAMLLIFPNTFEYFFILYSAVALRWNPVRFTRNQVIGAAAFIWIVIKLPQEYWIHIAKLDTTDLIKEDLLGMPADAGWGEAISENLWVVPAVLVLTVGILVLVRWVARRLPPADRHLSFDAGLEPKAPIHTESPLLHQPRIWLLEKTVLVGLVTVIFSQMLPGLDAAPIRTMIAVGIVIVINSLASHWLALRGTHWKSTLVEFITMSGVNLAIALLTIILLPIFDAGDIGILVLLFLSLMLTLIVTLYDHFRPVHDRYLASIEDGSPAP